MGRKRFRRGKDTPLQQFPTNCECNSCWPLLNFLYRPRPVPAVLVQEPAVGRISSGDLCDGGALGEGKLIARGLR